MDFIESDDEYEDRDPKVMWTWLANQLVLSKIGIGGYDLKQIQNKLESNQGETQYQEDVLANFRQFKKPPFKLTEEESQNIDHLLAIVESRIKKGILGKRMTMNIPKKLRQETFKDLLDKNIGSKSKNDKGTKVRVSKVKFGHSDASDDSE